jgi:DNA polymerase-1
MIAHYLINPDMRHNMDITWQNLFKILTTNLKHLLVKKRGRIKMCAMALEIKEYAAEMPMLPFQLKGICSRTRENAN